MRNACCVLNPLPFSIEKGNYELSPGGYRTYTLRLSDITPEFKENFHYLQTSIGTTPIFYISIHKNDETIVEIAGIFYVHLEEAITLLSNGANVY